MIPLQLSLEGIYSYQKRQTIDFTALTDAGLFGIFGAVASGKSTILEAISFALYGESDRMGNVNRAYNMMNLKSDRMYIEFDFLNFEKKEYRVVREYKRNSKSFEKVLHSSTTFYEWRDDEWIPLDHSDAELIIGLSCENFKRTIIIPQGKFKEFIELGGKDRTLMMKEIFNLHQYELYGNVRTLFTANEEKLNTLLGQLSGYDEVTEEFITEQETIYTEQKANFDKQQAEHIKLSETFEQLKQLNLDFSNLQKLNVKLAAEEANKKQIEESEKSLKLYVSTYQQFDEILRLKQQLSQKISDENKNLNSKTKELFANQEKSNEVSEKLVELKPFIDAIETKKEEVADLELISQIVTHRIAIKEGEERTIKGRTVVEKLSEEAESYMKKIAETDKNIETINGKLIDAKTLTSIEVWFTTHKGLSKQVTERKSKLISLTEEIKAVDAKFHAMNYSQDSWKESIEKQKETLNKQLSQANDLKMQLKVKQEIAQFANEIHDGSECPLCGSLEHPHIIETQDVSAEILENETNLKVLKQQTEMLTKTDQALIRLQESKNSLIKNYQDSKSELEKLEEETKQHLSLFVWDTFSPTDEVTFKTKKRCNDIILVEKEELEKNQKTNRTQLESTNKKLTASKELLSEIEEKNREKETLITADSKRIKHLQLSEFENETVATINQTVSERKQIIKTKQEEQSRFEKQKNDLLLTISAQKATIEAIEKNIAQLTKEQLANNAQIDAQFSRSSFESLEEIELLLKNKRDVEAERVVIERFKINYAKLKQSIEELEKKLEGTSFSPEQFEVKKQEFLESEDLISKLKEKLITLSHDRERIRKEYIEKKKLLIEKDKLETRKANISTLTQLFKGSGFVNYVSSIYLRNLCESANKRFHRLTKNQLSLQINDRNEFEIIDYLNDGRSRSVKTLSGGQNFQVSLSLALALAESVQSLTNSEKNFFFIDEGFGTQDAESVNIVFETLSNLQKENRIVGIISHVEELQERIPKSLFIRKDLEKGSLVETMD